MLPSCKMSMLVRTSERLSILVGRRANKQPPHDKQHVRNSLVSKAEAEKALSFKFEALEF